MKRRYRRIVAKFGTNLLTNGSESLDIDHIRTLVDQVAALRQDEAVLGTSTAEKKEAAKIQSSLHDLQFRLQELTERRKQMFELMTNLSSKEHEMARAAIANLGRA